MPNFAPKIDVKVGSKIAQKSAKTLVFFGQSTFLLCSGGDLTPFHGSIFRYFPWYFPGNFHQGGKLRKVAEAKVWSFLVSARTFFMCVLVFLHPFPARKVVGSINRLVQFKNGDAWQIFPPI